MDKENIEENARIQAESVNKCRTDSLRADERVRENSRGTEEQRRIDTLRHEQTQRDNVFRLHREEQNRVEERRRSEAYRKEARKSKYPHGLRNGNDLVTVTARLIYDLGKSLKGDISRIGDNISTIREHHEEALADRAAKNEFYKEQMADIDRRIQREKGVELQKKEPQEKERQQRGQAEKENPALERYKAHSLALNDKVREYIEGHSHAHDMGHSR